MRRRDLIKLAGAPIAAATIPASLSSMAEAADISAVPNAGVSTAELNNREFRLTLSAGQGLRCRLVHVSTGTVLADGPYFFSFGDPVFDLVKQDTHSISLVGKAAGQILIEHIFAMDPQNNWLEEQIKITNSGAAPLEFSNLRCALTLPVVLQEEEALPQTSQSRFVAVPFRREPGDSTRGYMDYSLSQIMTQQSHSSLWERYVTTSERVTPRFAAEAWIWTRGRCTCLISKYSQAGMEWSLLDRGPLSNRASMLRFGGAGTYRGQPEHAIWLEPGQSHEFGITRFTAISAEHALQGYYTFRLEMARRGHDCPADFNPPLHWNELYDNKLLGGSGDMDGAENRKKYYSLPDMKYAAEQAKAFSCEALYLDPGWDTNFASKIWDEARLGSFESFTFMLKTQYGLECSLHTPLAGWCNPSTYPPNCYRMLPNGDRLTWDDTAWLAGSNDELRLFQPPICGASTQYVDETVKRLNELARGGAVFFMFDGTAYHDECWDPSHGHTIPARMEAHTQAAARIARLVHEQFPKVLIEMHDPVAGGMRSHFTPIYYGHGPARCATKHGTTTSFDSVWAFELMWQPMEDLLSGRSIALYYYNLAYSLPLYVHIDLRTDNRNCLVFWWNASTCRHLGIGGTHKDPVVVAAHKQAMKAYRRLKSYFANGVFYGIDEMTHVHSSRDGRSAVINCFNLEDQPAEREIRIVPAQLGLEAGKTYRFSGVDGRKSGETYLVKVHIPAKGHALIEVM